MFFIFFIICHFHFIPASTVECAEIRAVIDSVEKVQSYLVDNSALRKGCYAFTDHIYLNSTTNSHDDFIRIREYKITEWKQKSVVVTRKIRDVGKAHHKMAFQEEYDTTEQARLLIPENFFKLCSFYRSGLEFELNNMHIYVEEIERIQPSVEIIASTQKEIFDLFEAIKIERIINESAFEWYLRSTLTN